MSFVTAEHGRTLTQRRKFGTSIPLFNAGRVSTLSAMIAAGLPTRLQQKWDAILAVDNAYQPVGPLDPWHFPQYADDPVGNEALVSFVRADAEKAVDLAVRWRVLGNPVDAAAVRRIVEPWTTIQTIVNTADSRLNWANKWPMFMQAAQLISDSPSYTAGFHTAMENVTAYGLDYSPAFIQTENRAMWGCLLNVASGAFLNDRQIFDAGIARWCELFDTDIQHNIPVGELDREKDSLHYSNFLLNAMTQTAEIARFNGEWLYDYTTPDGSSFRGLWLNVSRWTAQPETFTYWPNSQTVRIQAHVDPLHALWPNDDSQKLIDTYTTTQDFYGYRQGMLAYRDRPLYG